MGQAERDPKYRQRSKPTERKYQRKIQNQSQNNTRGSEKTGNRMSHWQQAEEARTGGRKNGAGAGTGSDELATRTETLGFK